jgi:Transposase Tn5 dimerisation domain/Transposase DNA-binding
MHEKAVSGRIDPPTGHLESASLGALEQELGTIDLGDARLNRRAQRLIKQLGAHPSASIPTACGGWGETRAAYRLLDQARVTAAQVLAPHAERTQERLRVQERVLCIEDTSELDYTTKKGRIADLGPLNYETRRGLYLHPTLAVTPDRVPLGVLNVHYWAREPGSLGQDKAASRPLEEKESVRWVDGFAQVNALAEELPATRLTYIADREGDLYDLFVEAPCPEQGADWLVRGQYYERRLTDGRPLSAALAAAPVLTTITFTRPAGHGKPARPVEQQLKAVRVTLKGPRRPDRQLSDVTVSALLATEVNPPADDEPVEWLLLTNLPIDTPAEALEKIAWYLCRWQVEVFFKILKSGCKIEQLQLESRDRLEPAITFYMIIAWRVLLLTHLGRHCPEMPCDVVFEEAEWKAVYLVTQHQVPPQEPPSLDTMVRLVATLGGFLNRTSDGFPGPQSLWIGLQRAADFVLALEAQRSAGGSYG